MAPTAIKNSDVPTVIRADYLLTPSRSLTEQLGLCQNDRPAIHCQPDYTRYSSGEKSGRPKRASSPRALTVVHLRSALSFRSSSASCALSTVESSLPLSLPLSSWRSPLRLVSSSPVTAPTACFARPPILSVFSPIVGLLGCTGLWPRRVAQATMTRARGVDGQRECRWTLRRPSLRSTMAPERTITLAVRSSGLDLQPRRPRE